MSLAGTEEPKIICNLHFSTTTNEVEVTGMAEPEGGSGDLENEISVGLGYPS